MLIGVCRGDNEYFVLGRSIVHAGGVLKAPLSTWIIYRQAKGNATHIDIPPSLIHEPMCLVRFSLKPALWMESRQHAGASTDAFRVGSRVSKERVMWIHRFESLKWHFRDYRNALCCFHFSYILGSLEETAINLVRDLRAEAKVYRILKAFQYVLFAFGHRFRLIAGKTCIIDIWMGKDWLIEIESTRMDLCGEKPLGKVD